MNWQMLACILLAALVVIGALILRALLSLDELFWEYIPEFLAQIRKTRELLGEKQPPP